MFLVFRARRRRILDYMATRDIHPSVRLGDVIMDENVSIGEGTYMGSGQIYAGKQSRVTIGRFCAIGYNVHIKARSHDPNNPTSAGRPQQKVEADISIGNHVWIGDNVFILPGISVGDHVIIGASAVVTRDVPDYAVVGGVPARLIRMRPEGKSEAMNMVKVSEV